MEQFFAELLCKMMNGTDMLKKLVSYFKPHLKLFVIDMICAVAAAAIELAFPAVSRYAMYSLLPEKAFETFFIIMGIILICYVLRAFCYYVMTYIGHTFGIRVETDIRADLFKHIQTLDFDFFDRMRTGNIMSRLTSDLFEITELSHHGPEDLLISILTIAGAFFMMFRMEWRLAIVVALLIPLFIAVVMIERKNMGRTSTEVKKKTAIISSDIESSISGIRTSKAFANEDVDLLRFETANGLYRESKKDFYKAMGRFNASMEFFMGIMPAAVITAGGALIMKDELNYIDLITFTLYVNSFIQPVRKLANFAEQFANGMAGMRRFGEIMAIEPAVKEAPAARPLAVSAGEVDIRNVSFSYGRAGSEAADLRNDGAAGAGNSGENTQAADSLEERASRRILSGVSIHAAQGEMIAVVGPSGAGKTTLCQLIPRFYDVESGSITIDGQDIRDVTKYSLRSQVGMVQQDVFIFADTIRENIRYGRPEASNEEVAAAAKRAEIYEDISEMPDGFDTYVGERGTRLSGGQKQRIAIARIFLKNPQILILDEATSALDTITEEKIQKSFDELMKGRTSFVIAHRLSTVRSADRIVVIDNGTIAEQGTHEELLARGGEYASLYNAQKLFDTKADMENKT